MLKLATLLFLVLDCLYFITACAFLRHTKVRFILLNLELIMNQVYVLFYVSPLFLVNTQRLEEKSYSVNS